MAEDDWSSRRGVLRWGARLAIGLPALVAGLHIAGATAHADDDDDDDDDDRRGRNRGRGRRVRVEVENERRENLTFSADLVPTNMLNGSDFSGAGDSGRGSLAVFSNETNANSISVRLRGANANTTYTLVFQPVNGPRTGSLGTLTTNAAGNATAVFNGVLGESGSATSNGLGTRVGVFVLTKSAGDAFVTAA